MDLPIAGRQIARLSFARFVPYVTLELPSLSSEDGATGFDFVLQIDGPYRFSAPGQDWSADPADGPDPRCVQWLGWSIAAAAANEDGELRVEFADGGVLEVKSFAYEPWQLSRSDGWSVMSVAGGGLAVTQGA
jgi:hypothetical protein